MQRRECLIAGKLRKAIAELELSIGLARTMAGRKVGGGCSWQRVAAANVEGHAMLWSRVIRCGWVIPVCECLCVRGCSLWK